MIEKRFTRHKSLDGDCTIYDELNDFQFPSLPLGVSKIFYEKLNELAEENQRLQERNDRQCQTLDKLYKLIEHQDWYKLNSIIQELKEADERLEKEWKDIE